MAELEKEFDEGPALAAVEQGTGLETHNVLAEPIMSTNAPPPVGPYPHAKRVGNLLFLNLSLFALDAIRSWRRLKSSVDHSLPGASGP